MANITYIEADGQAKTVDVPNGWSVMQGAVANGVPGIVGECGGSLACATCHCYVDESWLQDLPKPSVNELDLLTMAASEVKPNSRLACQIKAGPELDGLFVHLPPAQI